MAINNRVWTLGAVLLTAIIVAATWFIGVSPMLGTASAAADERQSVSDQNQLQELRLKDLEQRYAKISTLQSELDDQRRLVPGAAQLPRFIGQLDAIQAASGVTVQEVTFLDAVPYEPEVEEAAPAEEGAEEGGGSPTDAVAAADAPQVDASLVNASNFVAIPVTVRASGEFGQVMSFVSGVQNGERLFLATALAVTQEAEGGVFTGDITGYIYVLLDDAVVADLETTEETTESSTASAE